MEIPSRTARRRASIRIRAAAGFVLVLSCAAALRSATDTTEKAAKIDKLVAQYADFGLFSGTVLVSEHDRVIFRHGYGLANREWNIANAPDVKFRLGSITKQFTSMLVMKQVAKGAIKLDGHVSDYLSYYRRDTGARVTVHQLLNHTSGIPSYTDDPKFFSDFSRNYYPVDDFVKRFCSGDLQFEPASKFHYDNSGYFLLGAILEHVTGKSYEVLLKEQIVDPLGMTSTGYDHSATILPKRATGYQRGLGEIDNAPYLDMALPYAAGSLYSTVDDLYKWDQALYTDRLLPPDLKHRIFTPGLEHYGYGWFIVTISKNDPGAGRTMVYHGGGINGFNTLEQRLPDDHDLIVLFNNLPGPNLSEIAKGIRAVLFGQQPKLPKRSLVAVLGETIAHHDVQAAVTQYRELKRTNRDGYDFEIASLDDLGSILLTHKSVADAIVILKLNAEDYPNSTRAHNSLAEAYEKDGQAQLAIEHYHKTMAIDPQNQRAKDRLTALEGR